MGQFNPAISYALWNRPLEIAQATPWLLGSNFTGTRWEPIVDFAIYDHQHKLLTHDRFSKPEQIHGCDDAYQWLLVFGRAPYGQAAAREIALGRGASCETEDAQETFPALACLVHKTGESTFTIAANFWIGQNTAGDRDGFNVVRNGTLAGGSTDPGQLFLDFGANPFEFVAAGRF